MPRTRSRGQPRQARPPSPLLSPRGRRAAIAITAVCAAALAGLSIWLAGTTEPRWLDRQVDRHLRTGLHSWSPVLHYFVDLADPYQSVLITAGLMVACLAVRRWRAALLLAVAAPGASALTELVLKPLIRRGWDGYLEFPSGHTTAIFTQVTVIVVLMSRPGRLPGALRAAVSVAVAAIGAGVALAVVVLGFHVFTDTLGGISVGIGVTLIVALLIDAIARARGGDASQPPDTASRAPAAAASRE
jgi:membrane-associated phospholipid phosphatase